MDADVIIIGGGISGMLTAARLQARGLQTLVLESHARVGGCAGYFRRAGFAFDVGATTLVDFEPGGVGGQFMDEIGMALDAEVLPGYCAHLPDRKVTLYRDQRAWSAERLSAFGHSDAHKQFWALLDELAAVFWRASREGIRMPIRSIGDIKTIVRALPVRRWTLARYLTWTMADALEAHGLGDDVPLRALLGMLIQDTVHSSVERAPLINSALGVTIRGAGLTRARGGVYGFWTSLLEAYTRHGGAVLTSARVDAVSRLKDGFELRTRRGQFKAPQVISSLPIWNTAQLGMPKVNAALAPYMRRDEGSLGSAIVLFVGVPESEVEGQEMTHHQILVDYGAKMEDGNNMFVSISSPGDTVSAPEGHRAVMISTHCEVEPWEGLTKAGYAELKAKTTARLLEHARRVFPSLGEAPVVVKTGTPRTYAKFTRRWRGAVGGVRQTLKNSNQWSVPASIGPPGFWQVGDTTWPGLGTVACILGSRHVASDVAAFAGRRAR